MKPRCCNFAFQLCGPSSVTATTPGGSSVRPVANARLLPSSFIPSYIPPYFLSGPSNSIVPSPRSEDPCSSLFLSPNTYPPALIHARTGQGWPLLVWPKRWEIRLRLPRIWDSVNPPKVWDLVSHWLSTYLANIQGNVGNRRGYASFRHDGQKLRRNVERKSM